MGIYTFNEIDAKADEKIEEAYKKIRDLFSGEDIDRIRLKSYLGKDGEIFYLIYASDYLYMVHFKSLKFFVDRVKFKPEEKGNSLSEQELQNIERIINDEIRNISIKTPIPGIFF